MARALYEMKGEDGKRRYTVKQIADRLAVMLPEHAHHVEPFAGSLAVLLAKKPSRLETVNDLDRLACLAPPNEPPCATWLPTASPSPRQHAP
jgi:hypothetical protein